MFSASAEGLNEDFLKYRAGHPEYEELEITGHPEFRLELVAPSLGFVNKTVPWLHHWEIVQFMGADFSNLNGGELKQKINLESEIARMSKIVEDKSALNWYIKCDDQIVGNVNINSIKVDEEQKSGVMAILIGDPAYWGKKIARVINRQVIDWAFAKGGFTKLRARIVQQNIGSIKSFESLGFKEIGTEVDGELDGKALVWNLYEVSKEQWQSNPAKS